MMGTEFEGLVNRYGQTMVVQYGIDGESIETKGFLEPVLDRREEWEQRLPTAVGIVRQDRFIYLGHPDVPMDTVEDIYVQCRGKQYYVQTAQEIFVGDVRSHWWAILRVRDWEDEVIL